MSDSETVSTKVTKRNSDEKKVKVWLRETHSCLTEALHQNNNKIREKEIISIKSVQLVTSCCFLLLLSSSVCRTFCEENGFLCCVSNYTRHTKHTVWYSTSEPFLNSQRPRDSISLVSRHTAGQVSKYHPDTKSCWITERNPEHSKQLSASFHHHAATSQVSALKSSSSSTLYWRNLRYSVCLPKKKKKHPMGKKNYSH